MSKTALPFYVGDITTLAKTLRSRLLDSDRTPGHLELLNLLARSAGCRNFQHFRANVLARERMEVPVPPPAPIDFAKLGRLTRHFDAAGRLVRWPSKFNEQQPCLWALWSRLPAGGVLDEREVNRCLTAWHLFGDPALLRREMCDYGLMTRTPDCREYRRVERQPSPLGLALIRRLRTIS